MATNMAFWQLSPDASYMPDRGAAKVQDLAGTRLVYNLGQHQGATVSTCEACESSRACASSLTCGACEACSSCNTCIPMPYCLKSPLDGQQTNMVKALHIGVRMAKELLDYTDIFSGDLILSHRHRHSPLVPLMPFNPLVPLYPCAEWGVSVSLLASSAKEADVPE